jgi:carbonic anhydrase/acetyltransferase-like protein (isoleucine patch superfamily)
VAAGSVVIEKQQIGPYQLAVGVPAKIKKSLDRNSMKDLPQSVKNYLKLAVNHLELHRQP